MVSLGYISTIVVCVDTDYKLQWNNHVNTSLVQHSASHSDNLDYCHTEASTKSQPPSLSKNGYIGKSFTCPWRGWKITRTWCDVIERPNRIAYVFVKNIILEIMFQYDTVIVYFHWNYILVIVLWKKDDLNTLHECSTLSDAVCNSFVLRAFMQSVSFVFSFKVRCNVKCSC